MVTDGIAAPDQEIAGRAHAFEDAERVRILMALQDGRALPATRLAMETGIAPAKVRVHLARLLDAGLLKEVPPPLHHGRHRFFTLANAEVAALCASSFAKLPHAPVRSLQPGTREAAMRAARTCYDHLAGRLSVAMIDALRERQMLVPHETGFVLGTRGAAEFARFGIDLSALRARKRPFIRQCIDWSEQRPHLAGGLGSAVLAQIEVRGWIARSPADRTVTVTEAGRAGFRAWIGLDVDAIDTLTSDW